MRKYDDCILSPREREVLRHVHAGDQNKTIARILGITEATVKVHMKAIMRRVGVSNRTRLALWAERNPVLAGLGVAA